MLTSQRPVCRISQFLFVRLMNQNYPRPPCAHAEKLTGTTLRAWFFQIEKIRKGRTFPSLPLSRPSRFSRAQNPLQFHFERPPSKLTCKRICTVPCKRVADWTCANGVQISLFFSVIIYFIYFLLIARAFPWERPSYKMTP